MAVATTKGDLPLASLKQSLIASLPADKEWSNSDTCVTGNLMFLTIEDATQPPPSLVRFDTHTPIELIDSGNVIHTSTQNTVSVLNNETLEFSFMSCALGGAPSESITDPVTSYNLNYFTVEPGATVSLTFLPEEWVGSISYSLKWKSFLLDAAGDPVTQSEIHQTLTVSRASSGATPTATIIAGGPAGFFDPSRTVASSKITLEAA